MRFVVLILSTCLWSWSAVAAQVTFPIDVRGGDKQKTSRDGMLRIEVENKDADPVEVEFNVLDAKTYLAVAPDLWRSSLNEFEGQKDYDKILLPAEMTRPKSVVFQFKTEGKVYLCWTELGSESGFQSETCRPVYVRSPK